MVALVLLLTFFKHVYYTYYECMAGEKKNMNKRATKNMESALLL